MTEACPNIPIITLNVYGLNTQIERQRSADLTICCLQKLTSNKMTYYAGKENDKACKHYSFNQKGI